MPHDLSAAGDDSVSRFSKQNKKGGSETEPPFLPHTKAIKVITAFVQPPM